MPQKTNWIYYFLIGISFLSLTLSSCDEGEVEFKLDVDIIYSNETSQVIKYHELANDQQQLLFELSPNSETTIEVRTSGGDKNQSIDNCCQGILGDFQGDNSILVEYNNSDKCLIYLSGLGSTTSNMSVYERREISNRYYEFIYRFTEVEYNQSESCN